MSGQLQNNTVKSAIPITINRVINCNWFITSAKEVMQTPDCCLLITLLTPQLTEV